MNPVNLSALPVLKPNPFNVPPVTMDIFSISTPVYNAQIFQDTLDTLTNLQIAKKFVEMVLQ